MWEKSKRNSPCDCIYKARMISPVVSKGGERVITIVSSLQGENGRHLQMYICFQSFNPQKEKSLALELFLSFLCCRLLSPMLLLVLAFWRKLSLQLLKSDNIKRGHAKTIYSLICMGVYWREIAGFGKIMVDKNSLWASSLAFSFLWFSCSVLLKCRQ